MLSVFRRIRTTRTCIQVEMQSPVSRRMLERPRAGVRPASTCGGSEHTSMRDLQGPWHYCVSVPMDGIRDTSTGASCTRTSGATIHRRRDDGENPGTAAAGRAGKPASATAAAAAAAAAPGGGESSDGHGILRSVDPAGAAAASAGKLASAGRPACAHALSGRRGAGCATAITTGRRWLC